MGIRRRVRVGALLGLVALVGLGACGISITGIDPGSDLDASPDGLAPDGSSSSGSLESGAPADTGGETSVDARSDASAPDGDADARLDAPDTGADAADADADANVPDANPDVVATGCVATGCPANGLCDPLSGTCTIACNDLNDCDQVACPPGTTCVFDCTSLTAQTVCSNISCGAESACDIRCQSENACANIGCGTAKTCDVACNGKDRCSQVSCQNAEQCTFTCTQGNACSGMSCPTTNCSCPLGHCSP